MGSERTSRIRKHPRRSGNAGPRLRPTAPAAGPAAWSRSSGTGVWRGRTPHPRRQAIRRQALRVDIHRLAAARGRCRIARRPGSRGFPSPPAASAQQHRAAIHSAFCAPGQQHLLPRAAIPRRGRMVRADAQSAAGRRVRTSPMSAPRNRAFPAPATRRAASSGGQTASGPPGRR